MKKRISASALALIGLSLFAGCQQAAPQEEQPTQETEQNIPVVAAEVTDLDLLLMESFPLQLSATVKGNFKNGCEKLKEILRKRDGNTFTLTVSTTSEGDACTQALIPFEEKAPLDIYGLQKGEYKVVAGNIKKTFTLNQDNVLEQ